MINKETFINRNPADAMQAAAARKWLARNSELNTPEQIDSQTEIGSNRLKTSGTFDGTRRVGNIAPKKTGEDAYGGYDSKYVR